jgi:hypothetical protein
VLDDGTILRGRGFTVFVTPQELGCRYGGGSLPCTFYEIRFVQAFSDPPVCTATVYGAESFQKQPVSILITGTNAEALGVETGTYSEGSGSFPFSFICVQ